jgi:uncharacterized protein YukE
MGKKVDIAEVSDLSDDLSSTTSDITAQLDSIKSNIDQINSMDSFSGQAAIQAKGYFNDLHRTILESFGNLFTDLDSQLKQHLGLFQSTVDSSVTAIVESDYLNETKMDVDDEYENINGERQSINRTINDVADISSVTAPVFSSVTNDKNEAVETIFDMEEDLASFTSEGSQHDSQTKDLLHQIEVAINRANAQSGTARFTDYESRSTDVGLAVLRGYTNTGQQEEIENLSDEESAIIAKAEADYENGNIDQSTLNSIKSGVIATGGAFVRSAATSVITKEVSEAITGTAVNWLQRNTEHFVNLGLVAAPVNGNNTLIPKPTSKLSEYVRTGARQAPTAIGSAIDFTMQVSQGEDATHAAIKTGGHLAAGATGAKIGLAIGSVIPVGGTIIGGAIGLGLGVAGSMAFDWLYDNNIADAVDSAKETISSGIESAKDMVGDAISGIADGLGSLFG